MYLLNIIRKFIHFYMEDKNQAIDPTGYMYIGTDRKTFFWVRPHLTSDSMKDSLKPVSIFHYTLKQSTCMIIASLHDIDDHKNVHVNTALEWKNLSHWARFCKVQTPTAILVHAHYPDGRNGYFNVQLD